MKTNGGQMMDEILVKYLVGEATEAEQNQVHEWLKEDARNMQYFAHFKLLWNESSAIAADSAVDTDVAWARFKQRTQQRTIALPRPAPSYRGLKAAALLLLLAGAGWVAFYTARNNNTQPPLARNQPVLNPVNKQLPTESKTDPAPAPVNTNAEHNTASANVATASTVTPPVSPAIVKAKAHRKAAVALKPKTRFIKGDYAARRFAGDYVNGLFKYDHHTKDFICNNTPCPIEICIIQTVKCANGAPSAVSTCSILEPDESGQLRYKAFDKIKKNCNATIDEIRIKRVSTGETIVLNADSKPATAQEFFSYITGQKKGDITAGVFHRDCNDNKDDCGLTFYNSNLILQ